MNAIKAMKSELKEQANELRMIKQELKKCQRSNPYGAYKLQWEKDKRQSDYRHKHIAYCLMRGISYEQIERPRKGNHPNWERLRKECSYAEEAVRASA